MIGVYSIINLVNEKQYVGSSVDIDRRRSCHFSQLRNLCHPNKHLQASFVKYQEMAFQFNILEECTVENLLLREKYYIDLLGVLSKSNGYNAAPEPNFGSRGVKWNKESRQRLSKSLIEGYANNTRKRSKHRHNQKAKKRIAKAGIGRVSPNRRAIFCPQTDTTYVSLHETAKSLNMSVSGVCDILHKRRKSSCGYTFEYKDAKL